MICNNIQTPFHENILRNRKKTTFFSLGFHRVRIYRACSCSSTIVTNLTNQLPVLPDQLILNMKSVIAHFGSKAFSSLPSFLLPLSVAAAGRSLSQSCFCCCSCCQLRGGRHRRRVAASIDPPCNESVPTFFVFSASGKVRSSGDQRA